MSRTEEFEHAGEEVRSEVLDSEYLRELEEARGPEVFGPSDGPLENPAKEIETGKYFVEADERVPETSARKVQSDEKELPVDRRDFMRLFGAGSVFATTACVRRPVEKALPYVNQPVDQVVGVSTHYATTCGDCASKCGILVKTREGRPVKIEGSRAHPLSQGASCSLGQSTLQALFHPERRKQPMVRLNKESALTAGKWDDVISLLADQTNGKRVGILTKGSTGHRNEFLKDFLQKIGSDASNLFTFESNTMWAAQAEAHKIAFGKEGLPRTEINKSDMIVGVGSDLLENGIATTYTQRSFSQSQNYYPDGSGGRKGTFVQFESSYTVTGGRADERHVIPANSEVVAALLLVKSLLENDKSKGSQSEKNRVKKLLDAQQGLIASGYETVGVEKAKFDELAERMLGTTTTVYFGGSANFNGNTTALQLLAIMANVLVGAYGKTLFFDHGWMLPPVETGGIKRFLSKAADLDVLYVIDVDPAFTLPDTWGVKDALSKIGTVVTINASRTVTENYADFVLNGNHFLESWGDEQQVAGFWSMQQPVVRPAYNSRQAEDVLMWVAATAEKPMGHKDYYDYLKKKWRSIHKALGTKVDYDLFLKDAQKLGFRARLSKRPMPSLKDVSSSFRVNAAVNDGLVLLSPLDARLKDGIGADRPVLQEVGDAMTTIAWDSFLLMHPKTASQMGVRRNDVVKVASSAGEFEVAVYPMPGLHPNTVVVPRGNGKPDGVSKVTDGYGVNPLVAYARGEDLLSGEPATSGVSVTLTKTGRVYPLAAMQKNSDIGNRTDIIKEMPFKTAQKKVRDSVDLDTVPDLYPKLEEGEYRWGMSVDLTACIGCSACMVACNIENNVPQIGRKQILMGREMHWIRLDRYFSGPLDNPEVTFQPVMCQHCNHAPCEAVCPVYATTHDPEGMNSQTYNRCVGTRYCANACPYKVRRFNWFTHKWNIMGEKEIDRNVRALNPDVTVRTRGVMEKCTFCVQRVKEAKYKAKGERRKLLGNEVRTACQQACPSDAITFGNLSDPKSRVAMLRKDARSFAMLGADPSHGHYGIKTLPNVNYLAKVTFKEEKKNDHHG